MLLTGMGQGLQTGVSYEEALELYESARFVDVFEATRPLWRTPNAALALSTEERILAGRLAVRLGSFKFARALYDLASINDPRHPMVRYYCRARGRNQSLFSEIQQFEENPELATSDNDLRASWFASHALSYAHLRDFEKAHYWISRAHQEGSGRGWVESCHADLLNCEDRREEALHHAQEAWKRQPGMPYTAGSLCHALSQLNRVQEALSLLRATVANGQSLEVLLLLLSQLLRTIERGDEAARAAGVSEIFSLAPRFEKVAPLADRFAWRSLNFRLLDAARMAGDHEKMRELAKTVDSPFFNAIAKNLASNTGKRVLLPHKPVRQDHNTCLPASACTVLSTLGIEVEQRELAQQLTYEGTPSWRMQEFAAKRGLKMRPFIADREGVEALMAAGLPFIISFQSLNNAHACAVVGADFAMGTLIIHDPSLLDLREQLLEHLGSGEAPLGPVCAVIYPEAMAGKVEAIKLKDEAGARLFNNFWKAQEQNGAVAAWKEVKKAKLAGTPIGDYFESIALDINGRAREGLAIKHRLLQQWPDCVLMQRALISGTQALGDTALTREVLRKILERSPLPGVSGAQDYIYPAPHLFARYANYLRMSASELPAALRYVRKALQRGPFEAEAYVVLGEIHWQQGQFAQAALPYRIASTLHYENDINARYYADALHRLDKDHEAADWLLRRARHFAQKLEASGPYHMLVDTLEDFGFPARALESLREGLKARPYDGALAAFAATVFSRYALKEESASALKTAQEHAPRSEYHNAAAMIARAAGDLKGALEHARQRLAHEPSSMGARNLLLHLTEQMHGPGEALKLCEQWVAERPADDELETMLLERLDRDGQRERRMALLSARVKRNDLDAWAWRELAFSLLEKSGLATATRRLDARRELESAIAACERTCPDHAATLMIRAEEFMLRGKREQAFACCQRALAIDPGYLYAYNRLFDIARQLAGEYPKKSADIADQALSRVPGQWTIASTIAGRIGDLLGVDEARTRVSRWLRRSRRDPYPVSAWAELLLSHGRGMRDARRVVRRLRRAIARFPLHTSLRYALAHAYSMLQRPEEEIEVLKGIIGLSPHEVRARVYLSECCEARGNFEEAERELKAAADIDALDGRIWQALMSYYERRHDVEGAIAAAKAACDKVPDEMNHWERRIQFLGERGRVLDALNVANELASRFPSGAYAQLILARTMRNSRAPRGEIEAQFEKAISLNAQLFEAIDEYAEFLCTHARYEEARRAVSRRITGAENPWPLHMKLAEILRGERRNKEALDAIAELVRKRPDYYWGWKLLLEWSVEDKRVALAKELLPLVPPSLEENASFGAERLEFMERARFPSGETEAAWKVLVENFPRNRQIVFRRFDRLMEVGRTSEAEALIASFAEAEPDDAETLSRLVRVHCASKRREQSLKNAERLWFYSVNETWEAFNSAIETLRKAGFAPANLTHATKLIAAGRLPRPQALRQLAMTAAKLGHGGALTELSQVLEARALEYGSWEVFVSVLDAQVEVGNSRWVLDFRARRPDECWNDTQLWMIVGRALHKERDYRTTADWLANWEQRPGVEMWGVSNLVWSMLALGDYARCVELAQQFLTVLEHDHSAPFMAEGLLIAEFLAGNYDGVVLGLEQLGDVLGRAERKSRDHQALELVAELQAESGNLVLLKIDKRFRNLMVFGDLSYPASLLKAWNKALYKRLSWPFVVWHWLSTASVG